MCLLSGWAQTLEVWLFIRLRNKINSHPNKSHKKMEYFTTRLIKRGVYVCFMLSSFIVLYQIKEHVEYSYWNAHLKDIHYHKVLVRTIHYHNGSDTGLTKSSQESTVNLSLSQEPQARCSGTPQCDAVCMEFQNDISAQPADRPKAAVYYLVQPSRIHSVLDSLKALDTYFNNRFRYPVIIFHERNFNADHRAQVKNITTSNLYFQLVEFKIPDFIIQPFPKSNCKNVSIGYKHMCRFHSLCVYEQPIMKQLEYIWRLDDDSFILSNINQDLFRFMSDNDLVYGYTFVTNDGRRCVQHLWKTASSYIRENHIKTQFFNKWTEPKMYYNNFEVSATKLWYSAEYNEYINMIDRAGGIYYNRWGDAPIKSIAVSMFVPENKTHCFCDVKYKHQKMHRNP